MATPRGSKMISTASQVFAFLKERRVIQRHDCEGEQQFPSPLNQQPEKSSPSAKCQQISVSHGARETYETRVPQRPAERHERPGRKRTREKRPFDSSSDSSYSPPPSRVSHSARETHETRVSQAPAERHERPGRKRTREKRPFESSSDSSYSPPPSRVSHGARETNETRVPQAPAERHESQGRKIVKRPFESSSDSAYSPPSSRVSHGARETNETRVPQAPAERHESQGRKRKRVKRLFESSSDSAYSPPPSRVSYGARETNETRVPQGSAERHESRGRRRTRVKRPFESSSDSSYSPPPSRVPHGARETNETRVPQGSAERHECQRRKRTRVKRPLESSSDSSYSPPPSRSRMPLISSPAEVLESDHSSDCSSVVFPALLKESGGGGSDAKCKKHCCIFCQKFNSKMSTHLQRVHKNEPEVAQILAMKKGNLLRRQAFIKLQDQGDYKHNWRVLSSNKGNLIPKYRQKKGMKLDSDYVACIHCKALYHRRLLFKHVRRCSEQPDGEGKRMIKGKCSLLGRLLLPLPEGTSAAFFEKVIGKMKDDDISRVVRNDSLLLKYGERLFSRRDIEEHSSAQISCRLRELGRLSKILRDTSGMRIGTITQAIDPLNFDMLVGAVREIGEFSTSTNMCKKGSLVLKIGYSLQKCSDILKAEAIKQNDTDGSDKCQRFESLYKGDWSDRVSACASQSVQRAKMNKPKLLPSLADVEKVNHELEKDLKAETYPVLAKAVLAYVTVFNRKRGGEVQRMKCQDYRQGKNCEMSNPDQEILQNLTTTEKKLVGVLHRVEIRGKFNRPVPILLTPKMVDGIDRLLALRSLLGIDSEYLFVSQTGGNPYRGSAVIKQYANAANVSDSAVFTATALRKQLATLSQSLEISNFNQDYLASFLGHDLRVHRNIYRQPLEIMQKAKVASILFKVNKGVTFDVDSKDVLEDEEIDTDEPNEDPEDSDNPDNPVVDSIDKGRDNRVNAQESECHFTDMSTSNQPCSVLSTNPHKARQKAIVKRWSEEEIIAVRRQLKQCISGNRVPQKHEAEKALSEELVLRQRNWKEIKYCVYNMLQKVRRR